MKTDTRTIADWLKSRWALLAGGSLVATIVLIVASAWWLKPRYNIDLSEVRSYDQVQLAAELQQSLDRIRQWKSPLAEGNNVATLVAWVKHPDNAYASSVEDLLRKSESPQFGALNGLVTELPPQTDKQLEAWRKLEEAKLRAELQLLADQSDAQHRKAAFMRLLEDPRYRTSLEAWNVPLPQEESLLERAAALVWSSRRPNIEAWADQYTQAYKQQTLRHVRLYGELRKREMLPLGATPPDRPSLQLKRLAEQASDAPVTFAGDASTTDWEIVYRSAGNPQSQDWKTEIATGVQLYGLPWENAELLSEDKTPDLHPSWPPPPGSSRVKLRTLQAFLRRSGLPSGLRLASVSVEARGKWQQPDLTLLLTLKQADLSGFAYQGKLDLTGQQTLDSQVEKLAAAATKDARQAALQLKQLAGIPVKIKPDERDPLVWLTTFSPPKAPSFTLRGQLNDDLSLVFEPLPQLGERLGWTAWVCKTEPKLASAKDSLRLKQVVVGSAVEGVLLTWELAAKDSKQTSELTAHVAADGIAKIDLSEETAALVQTLQVATTKPESPTSEPISAQVVQTAAQKVLQAKYPKVAPHVELAASEANGAAALHASVRIADWPALELGPITIRAVSEVSAAVAKLLSAESVKRAAARQWTDSEGEGIHRLGVGQANGTVQSWNPQTGTVMVSCQAPLGGRSVRWNESLHAAQSAWTGAAAEEISRQVVSQLHWEFSNTDVSIPEALRGVLVGVDPDPDLQDGSWLRLNPLRVRVRGRIRIPCLVNLALSARVAIDQNNGFEVNEVGIVHERTWQLPWCNLSDPSIRLNLEERMLTLSALFTPPLPSTGGPILGVRTDNFWLYISALHAEMSGRLDATRFRARTHLELLRYSNVASGELDCNFLEQTLTGQLEANNSLPILGPVVPLRISGQVRYSAHDGTLWMQSEISARRPNRGRLDLIVRFREMRVDLQGDVRVPFLGSQIEAYGTCALDGSSFELHGDGNFGPWEVALDAKPSGVTWDYRLAGMKLPWQHKASAVDDVDEEAVGRQLQRLEQDSGRITQASAAAESFVAEHFGIVSDPTQPPPPEPSPFAAFVAAGESPTLRLDEATQSVVVLLTQRGEATQSELFRFPKAGLELVGRLADYRSNVWVKPHPEVRGEYVQGVGHVLLFDHASPRMWHVYVPGGDAEAVVKEHSSSPTMTAVHQGQPFGWTRDLPPAEADRQIRTFRQYVAAYWLALHITKGYDLTDLELRTTPLGFEITSPNPLGPQGHRAAHLVMPRDQQTLVLLMDATQFDAARRDALFPRFAPLTGSAFLQGINADEQTLVYALYQPTPNNVWKWHLALNGPASWSNVPLDFVGMPPSAFDAQAADLGQALLVLPEGVRPQAAFIGPQGAALIDAAEQDRIWLLKSGEQPPRLRPLTRGQFTKWSSDDSLSLLPPAWRSPDGRASQPWPNVIRKALASWSETRAAEPEWGANPLGLLLGLNE